MIFLKGFLEALEASERFYKVSLWDYRGTKRIDRIFGGCLALYGRLLAVPNGWIEYFVQNCMEPRKEPTNRSRQFALGIPRKFLQAFQGFAESSWVL